MHRKLVIASLVLVFLAVYGDGFHKFFRRRSHVHGHHYRVVRRRSYRRVYHRRRITYYRRRRVPYYRRIHTWWRYNGVGKLNLGIWGLPAHTRSVAINIWFDQETVDSLSQIRREDEDMYGLYADQIENEMNQQMEAKDAKNLRAELDALTLDAKDSAPLFEVEPDIEV